MRPERSHGSERGEHDRDEPGDGSGRGQPRSCRSEAWWQQVHRWCTSLIAFIAFTGPAIAEARLSVDLVVETGTVAREGSRARAAHAAQSMRVPPADPGGRYGGGHVEEARTSCTAQRADRIDAVCGSAGPGGWPSWPASGWACTAGGRAGPGRPGGGGGGGSGRRAPVGGPTVAVGAAGGGDAGAGPRAGRHGDCATAEPHAARRRRCGLATPADAASRGSSRSTAAAARPAIRSRPTTARGIYHVPGGRFYDRTVAVRCYADPEPPPPTATARPRR